MSEETTPRDEPGADDAIRQARAWMLRVAEDPAAEAECKRWRESDSTHEQAWAEAVAVWDGAARLGSIERQDWRREIESLGGAKPRWSARPWMMAAGIAAIVLIVLPPLFDRPDLEAQTRVAEVRTLHLPDGSVVTLGARSGLEAQFEPESRRVVLREGQAFFEVVPDSKRPFTVVSGAVEIRVTGTKFDVRKVEDRVQVAVLEGRVEVRRRGALSFLGTEHPERVLTAGLKTELHGKTKELSPEQAVDTTPGAWRDGRLYYREATLAEIVADLRRYSQVPIEIDPAVATLRVTTSFNASQIESFLTSLTSSLPVARRQTDDGTIVLESRT